MPEGLHGSGGACGPGPSSSAAHCAWCLLTLPLPMQVSLSSSAWGDPSDEMRTKLKARLKSLATFMASQPASHQLNLSIASAALPMAQALAPWVTSLIVSAYQMDDMGKVLKGVIKVGQ